MRLVAEERREEFRRHPERARQYRQHPRAQAFQRGDHDGPTSSMGRMSDSSLLALVDDDSVNESL